MESSLAEGFAHIVAERPDITNGTARVGMWLIAAAERTGGFPIELNYKQVREGFERNGVHVKGTGCRHETIRAALEWMEQNGYLEAVQGKPTIMAFHSRIYRMKGLK
jgi:hypothetical protein